MALRCLYRVATLLALAHAAPRDNDLGLHRKDPGALVELPGKGVVDKDAVTQQAILVITSGIDYNTMPAGTYTETISDGVVRVIIVNEPATTTAGDNACPEECDCSGIEDRESEEVVDKEGDE
ncbi:hypothetical protein FZEAL_1501 [Fusarium zealandicum]|uniref:Uncharacterized protein n=1 Tax=Fusarium zealandicum TaxID=1053134 RepID=A0A8H4XPB3_9HYPO|nr:hypothetical protein FZEAL_1501 [Fusarium zealandicum]